MVKFQFLELCNGIKAINQYLAHALIKKSFVNIGIQELHSNYAMYQEFAYKLFFHKSNCCIFPTRIPWL
jgi:hypothetical protein